MQNLRGEGEPIQTVAAVKASQQAKGICLPTWVVRVNWAIDAVGLTR